MLLQERPAFVILGRDTIPPLFNSECTLNSKCKHVTIDRESPLIISTALHPAHIYPLAAEFAGRFVVAVDYIIMAVPRP